MEGQTAVAVLGQHREAQSVSLALGLGRRGKDKGGMDLCQGQARKWELADGDREGFRQGRGNYKIARTFGLKLAGSGGRCVMKSASAAKEMITSRRG